MHRTVSLSSTFQHARDIKTATFHKMARVFSTIFLLLPLFLDATLANDLELHQLNVLFRHGDRMPELFPERFPNDPNMYESFYPMGSGGLTNEGKRRMYRLGEVLRDRYGDFLGPDYEVGRLYAVSSDLPRTKMSLMLVLAALYRPSLSSKSTWNAGLDWQPIPVRYVEFQNDELFNRDTCESYLEEHTKVFDSSEIQNELKKFKPYMEELQLATGKKTPLTIQDVLILDNNLEIEKRLNLTMKPWMERALADVRTKEIRKFVYKIDSYNSKLRRLSSGYMLRRLNGDMLKARNKTSGYDKKISLYSGHDKNIIALLHSLNAYDLHIPQFGSALIFELLSRNDKYFVKISYWLGIPEEMKDYSIPGCDTLCPLEKFLSLTKPEEIQDEELTCVKKLDSYFSRK